ncbi:contact-dependent growth inhibition system immunity protein [Cupriavidus campinensis]
MNIMGQTTYPELWQFICGFFNQDYKLWGSNVDEIVQAYKDGTDSATHKEVILEIDRFKQDHLGRLDIAYRETFNDELDLDHWGYTVESFLDELKRLLQG